MNLLNIKKNETPASSNEESPVTSQGTQSEELYYRRPRYRVQEHDAEFRVTVDLPGVPKNEVEISVVEGILEIDASRRWEDRESWSPLAGVAEDGVAYRLRLSLGDAVDGEAISANLENGVLLLVLAKAVEKKPRRIEIN